MRSAAAFVGAATPAFVPTTRGRAAVSTRPTGSALPPPTRRAVVAPAPAPRMAADGDGNGAAEAAPKAKGKGKASTLTDADGFFRGEHVCVDCGYVFKYSPKRKVQFEQLPKDWKCPQCNAPKRRFARKAGDTIALDAGTSNAPILIFSILGLLGTLAFGVWAASSL